jgi:hypothetical protein
VRKADIVVKFRHAIVDRQGLADQFDRQLVAADLVCQHAKKMQAVGVTRVAREDVAIVLLGLLQAATLMQLDGIRKQIRGFGGPRFFARSRLLRHLGPHATLLPLGRARSAL